MELSEAIALINTPELHTGRPERWADLGAGSGLFSFALAELLADRSTVYAVEQNTIPLMRSNAPNNVLVQQVQKDFEQEDLELGMLDGMIAANSLHFISDKHSCLQKLFPQLQPGAPFIVVEYDLYESSRWVPFPLPAIELPDLFNPFGYHQFRLIGERQSVYHRSNIYSMIVEP